VHYAVVHEKRNLKEQKMLFAVTLPKKVMFRLVLLSALHKSGDNELHREHKTFILMTHSLINLEQIFSYRVFLELIFTYCDFLIVSELKFRFLGRIMFSST